MSRATLVPCFNAALSTFDLQPTTYRGPDEALTMTGKREVSTDRCRAGVWEIVTSLIIKLLQDLSNDLSHTLKGFDVLLRVIEVLLQPLDILP